MKISAGLILGVALIACKENGTQQPAPVQEEAQPQEYVPASPPLEADSDPRNFGRGAEGLNTRPEQPHPAEAIEEESPPGVVEEEEALEEKAIDQQANGVGANGVGANGVGASGDEVNGGAAASGGAANGSATATNGADGGVPGVDAGP